MTVSYDLREFNFQSYDATNDGSQAGLSLDKYLGVNVWSQMYKKLESKLQAYGTNVDTAVKDEIISLDRAQLELDVSWKPFRSYQKEVVRQIKGKGCDKPCDKFLNVKVRVISALDKFRKLHGLEKTSEKKSTESINSEPSTSAGSTSASAAENRSSNGSTSKSQSQSQNIEEYVPEPVTDISNSLDYTPSTLSNSVENVVASPMDHGHDDDDDDVYTPNVIGNNDSEITYTPTKIAHASKKTDLNRNDFTTQKKTKRIKSKHMMIFGGDSGDEIDKDSKSGLRREMRSTPNTSQINSEKPKLQGKLDEWVNHTRPKRHDAKKDCDRADDKKKIRRIGTNGKSEGIKKEMNEAEKMRYLRELYEDMDDMGISGGIGHINLKDMKIDDIIETFSEHKAALEKFFRSNVKIADHRWEPAQCYLIILNGLLSETQQQKMYLKVKAVFNKESVDSITSNHENLFWKGMVPEWALLVFMDKFSLSRSDAITQLTKQDRDTVQQDYPFDLDL